MDIQELIPRVIQGIATNGQVRPTLFAEMSTGNVQPFPLFHFIGDSPTKAHALFTEGRQAGLKRMEQEIRETVLVTEAWLIQEQRNPNPGMEPSANVPPKEAVIFAEATNAQPFHTRVKVYELKRKKGNVQELVYLNENVDPQGPMGVAFLAGWHSRAMSNEEVQQLQPQGMRAFLK